MERASSSPREPQSDRSRRAASRCTAIVHAVAKRVPYSHDGPYFLLPDGPPVAVDTQTVTGGAVVAGVRDDDDALLTFVDACTTVVGRAAVDTLWRPMPTERSEASPEPDDRIVDVWDTEDDRLGQMLALEAMPVRLIAEGAPVESADGAVIGRTMSSVVFRTSPEPVGDRLCFAPPRVDPSPGLRLCFSASAVEETTAPGMSTAVDTADVNEPSPPNRIDVTEVLTMGQLLPFEVYASLDLDALGACLPANPEEDDGFFHRFRIGVDAKGAAKSVETRKMGTTPAELCVQDRLRNTAFPASDDGSPAAIEIVVTAR